MIEPNEGHKKQYIGDGVYASYDGWYVVLETEREHGIETVYLDAETYEALPRYVANVTKAPEPSI